MARLRKDETTRGLNGNGLRAWGLLIVVLGMIGRSILQRGILGIGTLSTMELFEVMASSDEMMIVATVALICQAIETCAVPIFSFLVVQGFENTRNFKAYLMRMAGMALLSEIPYNLAMSGKLVDFQSRNPAFGLVLALIMLYLCRMFEDKGLKNRLISVLILIAALVWANMLKVEFGGCYVFVSFFIWIMRNKPVYRNLSCGAATIVCSLASPLFMAAPMGVMMIHFYNGEKGADNRLVNYLSYPVSLAIVGIISFFMFSV